MVRKLSRAGSTNSPRPRLRSLSHPNSRAPGLPRPALKPCWPRLTALQSGPGRRRVGEGGDGSFWAEAAEDSRAPDGLSSLARAAWGCEGPLELQGLREGDGGGAASAPGCGGTGREGSGPAVAACLPWGAGSSALAPASRSPSGLPGPTKNMTEAPAPPTPGRCPAGRYLSPPAPAATSGARWPNPADWETRSSPWPPYAGDCESRDTDPRQSGATSCTSMCAQLKMLRAGALRCN